MLFKSGNLVLLHMSSSKAAIRGNTNLQYLPPPFPQNKLCRVGLPSTGLYNKAFILAFTAALHHTAL